MQIDRSARKLADLLRDFRSGTISLPLLQRDFVWGYRKVRELFDSLYRRYPIGSFYLWKPIHEDVGITTKPSRAQHAITAPKGCLLLDGQQRIVSLLAGISQDGEGDPRNRIYFDLLADEKDGNCFLWGTKNPRKQFSLDTRPGVVPLSRVLSTQKIGIEQRIVITKEVLAALVDAKEIPNEESKRARWIQAKLSRLFDLFECTVPCQTLVFDGPDEDEENTPIDVFRRLNKGGKGLTMADVIVSKLARGETKDILKPMRATADRGEFKELGLGFKFIIRALATVHRGDSKLTKGEQAKKEKQFWDPRAGEDYRTVKGSWRRTEKALSTVVDMVVQEVGWTERRWLPSSNALIPVVYYLANKGGQDIGAKDAEHIVRYLCWAAVRRTFSGSVETAINRFVARIKSKRDSENPLTAQVLLKGFKEQEKARLNSLSIRNETRMNSPLMQAYLAMLVWQGARSWYSGTRLAQIARSTPDQLTVHHIFPKAYLIEHGKSRDIANTMANYAFLLDEDNKKLSKQDPQEAYLALPTKKRGYARAQLLIDSDYDLEDYEEFLDVRAKKLADALNSFIGLRP